MVDSSGELGVVALCIIGATIGGLIEYSAQVIGNHQSGQKLGDAWKNVNAGKIAKSAFSGAIAAIPGASVLRTTIDIVGGNIIEEGVNSFLNKDEFDINSVARNIASDTVSEIFVPDLFPTDEIPTLIRDIKKDAVASGIKGTRKLKRFLNSRQVKTVIVNAIRSSSNDYINENATGFITKQAVIVKACAQ